MDLLTALSELQLWEWIMRSSIAYLFLVVVAKWMGQRSVSQLRFIDFITALLLGDILAVPLSESEISLFGPMVCTLSIVFLYIANSWIMLKWRPWQRFLEPDPLILIKDGTIHLNNIRKARITVEYLLSALRLLQMEDISKIALALWEPGGNISAFLQTDTQTATKKDLGIITTSKFEYTPLVIKQGKVKREVLLKMGYDESRLYQQLAHQHNKEISQVNLATLSENGHIQLLDVLDDGKP
ncbi:hypothetical protein D3C76_494750 [compost metagenome]